MPMPQMGVCQDCRQIRFLSPKGFCEKCLRRGLKQALRSEPDELRKHPDLDELDRDLDRWYR